MIGLLQVPSSEASTDLSSKARPVCTALLLLAFILTPGRLFAQLNQRNGYQDPYGNQFGNNFGEEEEPKEKPGLAERNNITPKPLMTLNEEKQFIRTRQNDYTAALRTQNPRKSEEDLISAGVRDRIYRLTIPENWNNIANLRFELISDIDRSAGDDHPRTRDVALRAAVKFLTELLSDQPEFVRLNAVLLLGSLDEKNIDRHAGIPARPFLGAAQPLVDVVQSSDQRTDIKITALNGLGRILKDGKPPRNLRDDVSKVLVDELHASTSAKLSEGQTWYLWRIIEVLGLVDEPRTAIQQPLVVDALWDTMLNETLPPHIRSQAARSLSQLDFDGSFNLGLLAHEIVKLCGTMTVQYNKQPGLPYWRRCFMDLYFAFRAQQEREINEGWGLNVQADRASLRPHEKLVEGAYTQVLHMVNGVMEHDPGRPVPPQTLREAADWLNSNQPTDQKLHAGARTVEAIQKSHAPGPVPVPGNGETTAVSQKNDRDGVE